jgi:excisionase family DNA binding protein
MVDKVGKLDSVDNTPPATLQTCGKTGQTIMVESTLGPMDELPLDDPRKELKEGSPEYNRAELKRFRELCRKHDGLTSQFFAKFYLGVSQPRVVQLMAAGKLPFYTVMGKRLIPCDLLEQFAELERPTGRPRTLALATA